MISGLYVPHAISPQTKHSGPGSLDRAFESFRREISQDPRGNNIFEEHTKRGTELLILPHVKIGRKRSQRDRWIKTKTPIVLLPSARPQLVRQTKTHDPKIHV